MEPKELITSIAMESPDTKYAFTKSHFRDWLDHLVEQYDIFDKPHGKKLFKLTNSYGDFAVDGTSFDVMDPLYGKCAMAIRAMDSQILEQKRAFDNLIYNHNHEFTITGHKYPHSGFTTDGVYRVWFNKKLQFIVNEQDVNILLNRPKTIPCRPFDIMISKQTLINMVNRQK